MHTCHKKQLYRNILEYKIFFKIWQTGSYPNNQCCSWSNIFLILLIYHIFLLFIFYYIYLLYIIFIIIFYILFIYFFTVTAANKAKKYIYIIIRLHNITKFVLLPPCFTAGGDGVLRLICTVGFSPITARTLSVKLEISQFCGTASPICAVDLSSSFAFPLGVSQQTASSRLCQFHLSIIVSAVLDIYMSRLCYYITHISV